MTSILYGIRRRNASSTRSFGSRFVEKMINWSNGTWIFLPLARFRKSYRFSSGTIQRLSSSSVVIRCRPKSSITSVPQLLFICSGRFADVGGRVERDFQVVHRQLAADDDRRPADADPAVVDLAVVEQAFVGRQRHFLVHAGVEQPHDLAVDADRPRNPDRLAERLGDPLGDARLAVARRAEQEQAAAGVDRRARAAAASSCRSAGLRTPGAGPLPSDAGW